ncbi:ATP synthase F1 subunit delta [Pontibacillus halophilus JSM 076056 = DSM 19796]|uniref:ATP synthase F1 subunit delta n=1 Tax=Pontibacillus halophilus JSM 076056 = DSM 19796 TaxID=1385510 RepID=A0A0A5GMB7_9BACI|nr:DUF4275 family protein [Pontibacillus halophilus]KGX92310.1 ATP synthase F1 subunit delta [Pontibacillus halophilus JSM 076056 = DSM 19796]
MSQIKRIKDKGIPVSTCTYRGKELRQRWEEAFAHTLSLSQKRNIKLHQYLWHVFSWRKFPCKEGQQAMTAFNQVHKNACYLFYQGDEDTLLIRNATNLKAADVINNVDGYMDDVYVVDVDFKWTYVVTHEPDCGPYFFQSNWKTEQD